MAIKTTPFAPEKHFDTDEKQLRLLADAFSTKDAGYIADVLGVIARARGIAEIAKAAGVTPAGLYKGLAKGGDPKLSTVLGVIESVGMKVVVLPAAQDARKMVAALARKLVEHPGTRVQAGKGGLIAGPVKAAKKATRAVSGRAPKVAKRNDRRTPAH